MKCKISILLFVLISITQLNAQCFQDRHSQSILDSWASCEPSINPNPNLPESYWIMYDFSEIYQLGKTNVWNFNYPGQTTVGLKDVLISYSNNGTDWTDAGEYIFEQAPDTGFYEGDEGPDLSGISARYLLITALSNYGGDCVGLSEFKVEVLGIVSSNKEQILDITLNISPNPCNEFFNFEIGDYDSKGLQYRVTNALGQSIESGAITNNTSKTINTKAWSEGTYILSILEGNKVKSEKITVIR